ncbi:hypothetical protein EXIGLDRAFT_765946 [Exidia glandulosa HHB12029]|uniref:Uncharacterized protein n=1 Tax=Exidia glandulosa HHB12029 TaxID=1314781 RepID=A0A165K3U3_EXIGL|nr:hypothetical protein EXIGLDRAFT_765946 [Exidia glandulosa HHB12029]
MPLPYELRYPIGGRVDWARLNPTAKAKARELAPRRMKDFGLAWRCVSCPAPFKSSNTVRSPRGMVLCGTISDATLYSSATAS